MTRKTNLFITTRETAQVKILTPSSFIQEWNKRAPRNCKKHPIYGDSLNDFHQNEYLPEELSSIWLNFIIFLWPCSNSEIQIYVFAGIRLVATVTFETRSVDCMPADYEAFKRNLNQINCKEKIIQSLKFFHAFQLTSWDLEDLFLLEVHNILGMKTSQIPNHYSAECMIPENAKLLLLLIYY